MEDEECRIPYNAQPDDVLLEDYYYRNTIFHAEMCKLVCCFLSIIISATFIIIAASKRCIYNCPN